MSLRNAVSNSRFVKFNEKKLLEGKEFPLEKFA